MKTVHEVSIISGVSVRTLHHYDAIGLLKPTTLTKAGYRLYDDTAIGRLQSILLFRELQFSLKEIKSILDNPNFDQRKAFEEQIVLLKLQRKQIDKMISLAREMMKKGANTMDFSAFDKTEIAKYSAEAKRKWGETDAYKEYEQKSINQSHDEKENIADNLMKIFGEMGKIKHLRPESDEVQRSVNKLQQFITDNYYNCTPKILAGLGEMYVSDERFKAGIDCVGGNGTAEFAREAIKIFCTK